MIPQHRRTPRLVVCDPTGDPVTQGINDRAGIIYKRFCDIAGRPSAFIFQDLREIPVVEGHARLNIELQEAVYQALIKAQTFCIYLTAAIWKDAWPRDREPVALKAQAFNEVEVLLPAMIVVTSDVAVALVVDGSFARAERDGPSKR